MISNNSTAQSPKAQQIPDQQQIGKFCVVCMDLGNWPYFFDGRPDPPKAVSKERIHRACMVVMDDRMLELGQRLLGRAYCLLSLWALDQSHRHAGNSKQCWRCIVELVDSLERRDIEQVQWWCFSLWPVLRKLSEAEPDVDVDALLFTTED